MRASTFFTALAATAACSATAMAQGADDWVPGHWMGQATADALAKAEYLADRGNLRPDQDRVSLLGAYLDEGESASMTYSFDRGEEVVFVGGATDGCNDLDIKIYDAETGQLIDQDVLVDKTPIVFFQAPRSGRYKFELIHYDGSRAAFCSAVLLEQGWAGRAFDDMEAAVSRFLAMGDALDMNLGGASFHEQGWAMFGTMLHSGDSSEITGISLEHGDHIFFATSNSPHADIDIELRSSANRLIAEDSQPDGIPYVTTSQSGSGYRVKSKNHSSASPVFTIYGILDN